MLLNQHCGKYVDNIIVANSLLHVVCLVYLRLKHPHLQPALLPS